MIDISGDIIYFENRPVGFIIIPNGTMRDRFEEALGDTSEADELRALLKDETENADELHERIESAIRWIKKNYPNDAELIEILS